MVGPFIFIDHMGPAYLKDYQNLDVPPHPHIGLSTLTYLFEGAIMHRDSLGSEMEIQPGAVNWMTAGSGVVHSERTPAYLRTTDKILSLVYKYGWLYQRNWKIRLHHFLISKPQNSQIG